MADNKYDTQQERQDKYFDFLITQALDDVAQHRADAMVSRFENEPEPVFSDDFNREMDTLLHPGKKRKPNLGRIAATLIVVAGLALGCMTPPAQAFLQQLFSLLLNNYETHTKITITEAFGQEVAETLKAAEWDYIYYPEYLPDGFAFSDVQIYHNICVITFEQDIKLISIRQQKTGDLPKAGVDSENTSIESIKISEYNTLYPQKDNWQNIAYYNDDYLFSITISNASESDATISKYKSELIKITENLIRIQ